MLTWRISTPGRAYIHQGEKRWTHNVTFGATMLLGCRELLLPSFLQKGAMGTVATFQRLTRQSASLLCSSSTFPFQSVALRVVARLHVKLSFSDLLTLAKRHRGAWGLGIFLPRHLGAMDPNDREARVSLTSPDEECQECLPYVRKNRWKEGQLLAKWSWIQAQLIANYACPDPNWLGLGINESFKPPVLSKQDHKPRTKTAQIDLGPNMVNGPETNFTWK